MRTTITIVLFSIALAAALPASAQDAREHFLRGQAAYAQGDYEGALREWETAYGLDPRPLLQFNMSQAYERLGRLEDAATALETYLHQAPAEDVQQADARARLAAIRERLTHTAILIEGGPEGATILVDGEDRGRTPRPDPLRVTPGEHVVVVQLGDRRYESQVVVPAAQAIRVRVHMPEGPAAAPATGGGGGSEPPIAAIAVFSVAGVALITGAILGGVAMSTADGARAPNDANASSARGLAIGADVCLGVSAAAAAVGIVLAIVTSGGSAPASEAQSAGALELTPWAGPTGAGASATVRF